MVFDVSNVCTSVNEHQIGVNNTIQSGMDGEDVFVVYGGVLCC